MISCQFFDIASDGYWLSGSKVSSIYLNDSYFKNFDQMDYMFSSGLIVDNLCFSKSIFINFNLITGFIFFLQPVNLYLLQTKILNHTFYNNNAFNFIYLNAGTAIFDGSFFQDIKFFINGIVIFEIDGTELTIKNSIFHNNGWAYKVDPYKLSVLEINTLFYLWYDLSVIIYNSSFINNGSISLFSGFIETLVKSDLILIELCIFKATNQKVNFYYHGLLLRDAQTVLIRNNIFYGLHCSDFPSFIHNNGILSLQGESSYMKTLNNKISILINNTFISCQCQNGGSLSIINYHQIVLNKIQFFNSSATKKGGSFFIVSSTYLNLTNILAIHSKSVLGSVVSMENVYAAYCENMTFMNTFGNISGCMSVLNFYSLISVNLLSIESHSLRNGAILMLKSGSTIYLLNSIILYTQCLLYGGVIYLNNNGILNIDNFTVNSSSAYTAAFLYIDSCVFAEISNVFLLNMTAKMKGAAVFINNIQNFQASFWEIKDSAISDNGIIYVSNSEKLANMIFDHIICNNNNAIKGSCFYGEAYINMIISNFIGKNNTNNVIFFYWIFPIEIQLLNASFINGISDRNILYFNGINLKMINLNFQCISMKENLIKILTSENVIIKNIIFDRNRFISNFSIECFNIMDTNIEINKCTLMSSNMFHFSLILSQNSNFTISNFLINSIKVQEKSIINIENGILTVTDSIFYNNTGPILLIYDTSCMIINCSFVKNQKNIYFDATNIISLIKYNYKNQNLTIYKSNFINSDGLCILFAKIYEIIINYSFFSGNTNISGISGSDFQKLFVNSSNFTGFSGFKGSALSLYCSFILQTNSILINNSEFYNNHANFGGALYFQGFNKISLINSNFFNNIALKENNKYGIGGVLLIKGLNQQQINCLNIVENCKFMNNYAENLISTIFSTFYLNTTQLFFSNNSASNYPNPSISNFPIKILPYTQNDDILNFNLETSIIEIGSGESFNISFNLLDEFNQIILQENKFSARLIQSSLLNSDDHISIKNSDSITSFVGVLNFKDVLIKTSPNSSFYLELSVELIDYDFQPYLFQSQFLFFSRLCKIGEIYDKKLIVCKKCSQGYYSLIDPMNPIFIDQVCLSCKENALCPGENYLIPKEGYWRFNNITQMIILCPLKFSCIGLGVYTDLNEISYLILKNISIFQDKNLDLIHGTCMEGHVNNLCFECKYGYGKYNSNSSCEKCQIHNTILIIKIIFTSIFVIIYIYANAKFVNEDKSQIIDIVTKIVLNHIQKINIVLFLNLDNIYSIFADFFNFFESLSFLNEDVFLNDCFLQILIFDTSYISLYKTLASLVLPIVSSFLVLGLFYIINSNKSKLTKSSAKLNQLSLIFLISIFLFYPMLTKCSVSLLNCINLNENEKYLFLNPNIKCWSGIHQNFLVVISLVGIFVWGIFFPFNIFLYLRNKFKIKMSFKKTLIKKETDITLSSTVDSLKFFYRDYKKEFYYWESIIFFQKFSLSLLLNLNQLIQSEFINFFFLSILFIYLYFLINKKPFKINQMNILEFLSIVISILTKVLVIIIENDLVLKILISFMILFLNAVFFIFSFYYVLKLTEWKELYFGIKKKVSKLSEIITKRSIEKASKKLKIVNENNKPIISIQDNLQIY